MAVASTSKSASSIRITGTWGQTFRWLWIAFTIMALVLLVISLPPHYQESLVVCDGEDCAFINITSEEAARYEEAGITRETYALIGTVVGAASAIIYVLIGSFIFFSRSDELIALITAFAFVGVGITGPIDYLQPDNLLWEIGLRVLQGVTSIALCAFLLSFPNGRFVPRWTRWVLSAYVPILSISLIAVVFDYLDPDTSTSTLPFMLLLGLLSQIYRYLRISTQQERQQTKWVIAVFTGFMILVFVFPIFYQLFELSIITAVFEALLGFGMLTLLPVAVLVSILRYGLWDIDFYINRGIVYISLTALLVAVFAGIFFGLQTAFNTLLGGTQLGLELIIPSIVVAGLFNPARTRLRHFVDRRFYGIKMDYTQVIESRQKKIKQGDTSTNIGQYSATKRIGSGGMGEVYAGQDTTGQTVAIKVMLNQFEENAEIEQRFLREAQATAHLEHPNIVKILDVGNDEGRLFIAMEYVQGDDWGSILKSQGALPLEQVLPRLQELASALDYVHQNNIIHRDIKPSNVMIEAQTNRAVLMDFGIAKIATELTALTGTSQIVGSLDYISPEQIQGQEKLDHRTDIYSFGVMTYQLLTGELPFKKGNAGALVMAHLMQPPPDATEKNSKIPNAVSDAIQRAMAKQPDMRFNSLSDFISAMQD